MFCANCGAQMSDDDVFCSNCGTPVGQNVQFQTPISVSYVSAAPQKGNKSIAVLLVILIIAAAAIAGMVIIRNNTATKAPEISAADIQGRWVCMKRYKSTDPLCAFTEDGRYVTFKVQGTAKNVIDTPIPDDALEKWELMGSDLIRIKGMKGKDQLIKVIFNYDKSEALIVYLDDYRLCGGDISKCVEKYVRPEKYLEIVGIDD